MSLAEESVALLGSGGLLCDRVPGFVPREGQRALAGAIAAAIEAGEHLLAEAGTGIGKTFAYLVPILLGGRRALISTATRALQDQLFERDLPLVARALGRPLDVVVLKGRRNYLCRERWLRLAQDWVGVAAGGIKTELLAAWAAQTKTGDLAELPREGNPAVIAGLLTVGAEACLGKACPEFSRCHVYAARRRALEADVVIVNHNLLVADIALKAEGGGDLLGGADVVVVDEAHALPEVARLNLGETLSRAQIEELAEDAARALAVAFGPAAEESRTALRLREAAGIPLPQAAAGRRAWGELKDTWAPALGALGEWLQKLEAGIAGLDEATPLAARTRLFAARLAAFLAEDAEADPAWFHWVDVRENGQWTLNRSPLDSGGMLGPWIAESAAAWIFTSATLAVAGDFDSFTRDLGLPSARTALVESPFDYARQARLYLPPGLPAIDDPGYTEAVVAVAEPLIRAAQGGCFLLFTSRRALVQAATAVRARRLPYPILVQGEAPRSRLLAAFREAGNAILCGTASFWEGVDVKGDALVLVAIDRLPFASPGDPLLQARLEHCREQGGHPFGDIQLPEAAMALKQGAGRLIRDPCDHGVLMVCDPRLSSRSYGRVFLANLPPMPIVRTEREAVDFLLPDSPGLSACVS